MRRARWLLMIALLLAPTAAHALQLYWSSGADTLTFTEATRATLVLRADSAEVALPPEWRLLWVGDDTDVQIVARDSIEACMGDTAQVYMVEGATTPEDATAHRIYAHYCSSGPGAAAQATFLLALPAHGRASFKVTALAVGDSTTIIESNQVTCNGGASGGFLPYIATVQTSHLTTQLQVIATGAGLADATSASLGAPNDAWSIPLAITARTDSTLTASADIPVPLPSSVLKVRSSSGIATSSLLGADNIINTLTDVLPLSVRYTDPDVSLGVYPKDFAFTYTYLPNPWRIMFHLYYIRASRSDPQGTVLAHAWSYDLTNWTTNTAAFTPRARWDCQRVWAPSIVARGDSTFMFYTGVGWDGNQRIGYAERAVLDSTDGDGTVWRRDSAAVLEVSMLSSWARQGNGAALRDPFVTEYPAGSGQYLMMFVAQNPTAAGDKEVVGLVASPTGNLRRWDNRGYYGLTAVEDNEWGVVRIEAPMAFRDPASSVGWYLMYSDGGVDSRRYLRLERATSTTTALTDTNRTDWSILGNLYTWFGYPDSQYVVGWQGSEQFRLGSFDYFAAWDGTGINISRMLWQSGVFRLSNDLTTAVGEDITVGERFYIASMTRGASVQFGLNSARGGQADIRVYDVRGRLVRRVFLGEVRAGTTLIPWNCVDGGGQRVAPGLYFARCLRGGRSLTAKVAVAY